MEIYQAFVLGVVQGLTEFLPVSSSGHLVLFQHLFGLHEPELAFDISVHMGTLAAVLFFFRNDLRQIVSALFRIPAALGNHGTVSNLLARDEHVRMALLIVVGSIPTAILGLLFKDVADRLFSSVALVGAALLITAVLLWLTRIRGRSGTGILGCAVTAALAIGLVQGLAIVPGISRSGATIATGILLGLNRETAARYSFLLSIPAVFGAGLLGAKDLMGTGALPVSVVVGTLVSCIVGYGALRMLVYIVNQGRMHLFAPYCVIVGVTGLVLGW
jgi:undecaprenyl-diphosphatase